MAVDCSTFREMDRSIDKLSVQNGDKKSLSSLTALTKHIRTDPIEAQDTTHTALVKEKQEWLLALVRVKCEVAYFENDKHNFAFNHSPGIHG